MVSFRASRPRLGPARPLPGAAKASSHGARGPFVASGLRGQRCFRPWFVAASGRARGRRPSGGGVARLRLADE